MAIIVVIINFLVLSFISYFYIKEVYSLKKEIRNLKEDNENKQQELSKVFIMLSSITRRVDAITVKIKRKK